MGLFGAKLAIDAAELEFQLATLKWLAREFGPVDADTPLVTPTREWFTGRPPRNHADVEGLFGEVKAAAGMADWPCVLRAGQATRGVDGGNNLLLQHEGEPPPGGTFEIAGKQQRAIITYNPATMDDPEGLIAIFAHELAHYLMATAQTAPPGGWEIHELHTDLTAVYLGFGILMTNGAKTFRQFATGAGQGWQMAWRGYLSESALVVALILVERLAGRDPRAAAPYLKDYLANELRRGASVLERRFPDQEAAVAAIDLDAFA